MKTILPPPLIETIGEYTGKMRRYLHLLFFLLLAVIYGFIIIRINVLSNTQVSEEAISKEVSRTTSPHIDPESLKQLRSLNDNSVNVQTLFTQGRTNPFQE